MKIEAIIVCVNYSDFLKITLPLNLINFNHVVIITSLNDEKTKEYVKNLNNPSISLIETDVFTRNGAIFNKGAAINIAYSFLKYKDYICYLDSDIVIEDCFFDKFKQFNPNIEYFYGCPRRDFPQKNNWEDFVNGNVDKNKFIKYRGSGYGFFSVHNYKSNIFQKLLDYFNGYPYPFWFSNGAESDWVFRNYWGERIFCPKLGDFPQCHLEKNQDYDTGYYKELPFECYHLGEVGKNHNQRVTPEYK